MKKYLNLRPNIALGLIFAFLVNMFGPIPTVQAQDFRLPAPGIMVPLSPEFNPPILKGIKVHPDNPFRFDFILDKGDSPSVKRPYGDESESGVIASTTKQSQQEQLKTEANRLIKYFLASLTIPEKDLWVNLSPYEKNRIIPHSFGLTEMGRDLLAEDYMLKQITASVIYPEDAIGEKFWKRIYEEAAKKFGTTNIPVNTFNKVWIVPEKAVVYENAKAGTAYIVESKLKVMLEQDYLALEKNSATPQNDVNALGSNIVREIVIPELTKEVNEDKNFSQLRQVYNSLILATWYKKKIKDSILAQVYENKNKISGILSSPNASVGDPEHIYQRYLQAFKKGAYNYIKEEVDPLTEQPIPRKYFSGGVGFYGDMAMTVMHDQAMVHDGLPDSEFIISAAIDRASTVKETTQTLQLDPLVQQLFVAWDKKLEESRPYWKRDQRPEIYFPYNFEAPSIAYDPISLESKSLGPFQLLRFKDENLPEKLSLNVDYVDYMRGVRPQHSLVHELKNVLMDDPDNPQLLIVPNRFPVSEHHMMLLSRNQEPQEERPDFLASQFHWAQRGLVVEFHKHQPVTGHYHAQMFDPRDTAIIKYSENFKSIAEADEVHLGSLSGYPASNFAIASFNMEKLVEATMQAHQFFESRHILTTHDILRQKNGMLMAVFFLDTGAPMKFYFGPWGLLKSSSLELSETEVYESLQRALMSGEQLDNIRDEFWNRWTEKGKRSVLSIENAKDLFNFSTGEVRIRALEKKLQEVMDAIDSNNRAVIRGGTRYFRSGAREDIDIVLQGVESPEIWRRYIMSLAEAFRSVSGVNVEVLNTDHSLAHGVAHVETLRCLFVSEGITSRPVYIDILNDYGSLRDSIKLLSASLGVEDLDKPIDDNLLREYFRAEYYLGDPGIFDSMIGKYNDPVQRIALQGSRELRQRIRDLRNSILKFTKHEIESRIQQRLEESAAGPESPDAAMMVHVGWNMKNAALIPDIELIRHVGITIRQPNYVSNNYAVRAIFLNMLTEMENGIVFTPIEMRDALIELNQTMLSGKSGKDYYFSPTLSESEDITQIPGIFRDDHYALRLSETILGHLKVFSDPNFSKERTLIEVISFIFNFYYDFMRSLPFKRANNSLAMNMVNAMIRLYLENGISYGFLDEMIIRNYDVNIIRDQFLHDVQAANPGVNFNLNAAEFLAARSWNRVLLNAKLFYTYLPHSHFVRPYVGMTHEEVGGMAVSMGDLAAIENEEVWRNMKETLREYYKQINASGDSFEQWYSGFFSILGHITPNAFDAMYEKYDHLIASGVMPDEEHNVEIPVDIILQKDQIKVSFADSGEGVPLAELHNWMERSLPESRKKGAIGFVGLLGEGVDILLENARKMGIPIQYTTGHNEETWIFSQDAQGVKNLKRLALPMKGTEVEITLPLKARASGPSDNAMNSSDIFRFQGGELQSTQKMSEEERVREIANTIKLINESASGLETVGRVSRYQYLDIKISHLINSLPEPERKDYQSSLQNVHMAVEAPDPFARLKEILWYIPSIKRYVRITLKPGDDTTLLISYLFSLLKGNEFEVDYTSASRRQRKIPQDFWSTYSISYARSHYIPYIHPIAADAVLSLIDAMVEKGQKEIKMVDIFGGDGSFLEIFHHKFLEHFKGKEMPRIKYFLVESNETNYEEAKAKLDSLPGVESQIIKSDLLAGGPLPKEILGADIITSIGGGFNFQVANKNEAKRLMRSVRDALNDDGKLIVTGLSMTHFYSNDFRQNGFNVLNMSIPLNLIIGKPPRQMYILSKAAGGQRNFRSRLKGLTSLVRRASSTSTGGIDLSSDKALSIQNNGQGIKFHIDHAMLEQLQNAPGFVPLIINIQPMTDLRAYLGISANTT